MPKVEEYIKYLRKKQYPALFSGETETALANISSQYGDLETKETIQEISLTSGEKSCDYSIRIDCEANKYVKEYWLELDETACRSLPITPCWFVDASAVRPGTDLTWLKEQVMPNFLSAEEIQAIWSVFERCVGAMPGRAKELFQIGVMAGRRDRRMRLFLDDMKPGDIRDYLAELDWPGDLDRLRTLLERLSPYADKGKFIIDFDAARIGISEKLGINFGPRTKKQEETERLLDFLCREGLCREDKKEDVLRFTARYPSHTPYIQNDISHFKIPFQRDQILGAKAYLRQGSVPYVQTPAYETPVLMNLELTSRCPLRCPQCYCDLEKGKDLPLDKAKYWLDEAAENGVRYINLSGGETMCYPHIYEVTEYASGLGMEVNIAVSGYHFGENEIRRFTDAGVGDICVSLNGPSEEVNSPTRDGYGLAIRALESLKKAGFPRTCINWVMHDSNADTLQDMIALCERYQVRSLCVMVFKPDASHQRKSVPSEEQFVRAAKLIKGYKGNVSIEIESCFSQLRALVLNSYFMNRNVGIERGCGAGRDAVSINVEGKITPCRHIELEETYQSIADYWENSRVLQKLRHVEESKRRPCSDCRFQKNCLPCAAVNLKLFGEIYMGEEGCRLGYDSAEKSKKTGE